MRKTALFLAAMMVLATGLTGCGGKTTTGENTQNSSANEQAAQGGDEKTYDIVYLSPSTASQFWTYVGIGIENAKKDLEESKGIKINFSTVGPAQEAQTEDYITAFEQCIAKKPAAIVTATLAIDATIPKAAEATNNGIVLNFVNCGLGVGDDGANADTYNQFYYCSNDTIGEMARGICKCG